MMLATHFHLVPRLDCMGPYLYDPYALSWHGSLAQGILYLKPQAATWKTKEMGR